MTKLRYYPYGDSARYNPGGQITMFRFTGQRWDAGTGLYFYNSRWYNPSVNSVVRSILRFVRSAAPYFLPQPQRGIAEEIEGQHDLADAGAGGQAGLGRQEDLADGTAFGPSGRQGTGQAAGPEVLIA